MNFDKYFATYLYEHQFISLPNIGEFTLDKKISFVNEEEKKDFFPQEGIHFNINKKAITQPEFVQYIRSFIAKPISLIESDIEDYTLQIINWLNIGKPYTIEGIGTLTKLQNGEIEFSIGTLKVENISSIISSIANKESNFEGLVVETAIQKNAINTQKIGLIAVAILAVVLVVWAVSYFLNQSKENQLQEVQQQVAIVTDTTSTITPTTVDTTGLAVTSINDTIRYRMYFLASKYKEKADKQFAYWSKLEKVNRDEVIVNETLRYRLFIYKKALPKDTTDLKISLAKYFKHAITIEKEN